MSQLAEFGLLVLNIKNKSGRRSSKCTHTRSCVYTRTHAAVCKHMHPIASFVHSEFASKESRPPQDHRFDRRPSPRPVQHTDRRTPFTPRDTLPQKENSMRSSKGTQGPFYRAFYGTHAKPSTVQRSPPKGNKEFQWWRINNQTKPIGQRCVLRWRDPKRKRKKNAVNTVIILSLFSVLFISPSLYFLSDTFSSLRPLFLFHSFFHSLSFLCFVLFLSPFLFSFFFTFLSLSFLLSHVLGHREFDWDTK